MVVLARRDILTENLSGEQKCAEQREDLIEK
jgi:hypothetical protein